MQILSRRVLSIASIALFVAGCAAVPGPTTTTSWRDPGFNGPPFTKLFVVGLSAQSLTDQRGFENLMVSTLQSAGIVAVPGWQYAPTDRTPDQATMRAAVAQSGADGALLIRITNFTTQTTLEASPGVVTPVGSNMYVGWYEPGLVSADYQAAAIYTTLFDAASARAVWTFNPPDYSPATLQQDAPRFANDVTARLLASGLVAGR